MNEPSYGRWQPIATAPKDGSRVLVGIRASEQGPASVDVARWAKPDPAGEECWISDGSDPSCMIIYAEAELSFWMPLPEELPELRSSWPPVNGFAPARTAEGEEIGGSGI